MLWLLVTPDLVAEGVMLAQKAFHHVNTTLDLQLAPAVAPWPLIPYIKARISTPVSMSIQKKALGKQKKKPLFFIYLPSLVFRHRKSNFFQRKELWCTIWPLWEKSRGGAQWIFSQVNSKTFLKVLFLLYRQTAKPIILTYFSKGGATSFDFIFFYSKGGKKRSIMSGGRVFCYFGLEVVKDREEVDPGMTCWARWPQTNSRRKDGERSLKDLSSTYESIWGNLEAGFS